MRKIFVFLSFLLIAATANTQQTHVTFRGIRIYEGDTLLTKSEAKSLFSNTLAYDLYEKALSDRIVGGIMLGTGIATASIGLFGMMLTGLVHVMGEGDGPRNSYWRHGGGVCLGVILAGSGLTAGGIVLMRTGRKSVANAVDAYNSSLIRSSAGEFTFGFTPAGVGLAYRF